ncbi:M14 family zinc carboxypeptidase [Limnochorda pilosa]|uniref:Peptidase n=1 Tax=Limnochorda pilosa TaxID=1555112 RepID=A0A0K2SLT5_LIMPI|nr:M14 family zinc carboxypeptidase [Limnochorda pilosa]BAS27972.1 peptidase [Limnochorda pilosa]
MQESTGGFDAGRLDPGDLDALLGRVPGYERFLTVDELYEAARRVAERCPGIATYTELGTSTDGQPIPMLTIGDGPQHVMLVACPHPNEPVGAMLVRFLMDELVENRPLREGRTWSLLPCVDPDAVRLNEGWFHGPFTLRNYARHFYRPRSEEQVEWTFPVTYKTFRFDRPMPETRALMAAIERGRPNVLYSLHNAGFGGVFYYLSRDLKGAYEDLHRVPAERNLPLSLGEPEMPWAVAYHPAVYAVPRSTDAYDYYERFGSGDPADHITGGASSFEYAERISAPVSLVTEVPYFQSPKIADTTRVARSRRDVILAGVDRAREVLQVLDRLLEQTRPVMTAETRFLRAVSSFTEMGLKTLESQTRWASEAEGMDQPATVAQEVDAVHVGLFYRVLVASMLRRAFEHQQGVIRASVQGPSGTASPGSTGSVAEFSAKEASALIRRADEELEGHLDRWIAELEAHLPYTVIPIRDLVQVQYGALLAVMRAL